VQLLCRGKENGVDLLANDVQYAGLLSWRGFGSALYRLLILGMERLRLGGLVSLFLVRPQP